MRRVLFFLFCLFCTVPAGAETLPDPVTFDRDVVMVETTTGRYGFDVELAKTPEQLMRGLMFRTELAPSAGMLFLFGEETETAFWMKNTFLPLDMIFIRSNGAVARVAENTTPLSLEQVPSGEPVLAVLEVNAGTADRFGINAGSVVIHPAFGNLDRLKDIAPVAP